MTYDDWLDGYFDGGFQTVKGWVSHQFIPVLKTLNAIQAELATEGGIVEIGVHHGRLFIALNGMVETEATPSYAIDLFAEQSLNIDHSGAGNQTRFLDNLATHDRHGGRNVACITADSTRLTPEQRAELRRVPARIVSVDGGQTVEHTINDIEIAAETVHARGVVLVDDILHPHWPGVIEGVVTYLQRRPTLWPVFIGGNKLVMAPMSVHRLYLEGFQTRFNRAKPVTLGGYPLLAT